MRMASAPARCRPSSRSCRTRWSCWSPIHRSRNKWTPESIDCPSARASGPRPLTLEVHPMGTWKLDPYHTQVEFSAKHLGMMTVRGHFAEVTASGDIDVEHPERSTVEATIATASIRTHNAQRDNDLRSSNFLEADAHPTITFKSTKIEPAGADRYTMTGDLTIKGNTHPVTLNV